MKLSFTLFLAVLAAGPCVAEPQEQENAVPTPTEPQLTPQQSCAIGCATNDLSCQARCGGVPNPSEDQVNETTECVASCDQGDGSAEATQRFSECRDACISTFFLTVTREGVIPIATAVDGDDDEDSDSENDSAASAASSAASSFVSSVSSAVASATNEAAEVTEDSAAVNVRMGSAAGLVAFAMAVLAL